MKRLYLDVCSLCRPFDDQQQLRIRLETDAVLMVLWHIEQGNYQAITSPVHHQEVAAINDGEERLEIQTLLKKFMATDPKLDLVGLRRRAEALHDNGLGIADAAHIAFAEKTADFFISCDDKLLKRCKKIGIHIKTLNPVEFITAEELT